MLYSAEFPEGFRAGVSLRGFSTGRGRQPQSASQQQSLVKLRDQIQCLLAAEGFVAEPVGGCPISDALDTEQVSRIVQGVVGELKRRGMA
jgi:4-hydroxy-tetrahydrodipicolinate synthase